MRFMVGQCYIRVYYGIEYLNGLFWGLIGVYVLGEVEEGVRKIGFYEICVS